MSNTMPAPLVRPVGLDRLRWAARDSWVIALRDMNEWVREPQIIVWGLLFPIMFVLLFAYVFGSGIIVPGGGNYREFLMAGMFAQTMAFGIGDTMMTVHTDAALKGVTDRFRSMPMAPSAVVVGRCIASMVYSAVSLGILVACGLAIGWRWHGTYRRSCGGLRAAAPAPAGVPVDWHLPRPEGQEPGDGELGVRPAVSRDDAPRAPSWRPSLMPGSASARSPSGTRSRPPSPPPAGCSTTPRAEASGWPGRACHCALVSPGRSSSAC